MNHIFISYSSKNRDFALKLADSLDRFFDTWIDREGIWGGLEWEEAIEKGIKDCIVFVVIVSPDSNMSDWVARETIRAEHLDKYRIPALLDGELPLRLLNLQFIDFRGDFEGGFGDLLQVLNTHFDPAEKHRLEADRLIGAGIRAWLSGDQTQANHLVGQALALQPGISRDVWAFWQQLRAATGAGYAEDLRVWIAGGHVPIIEHTTQLPERYAEGNVMYEWNIELDLPDDLLERVDFVRYRLHHTFQPPERTVRNRQSRFRLTMRGWGTFNIPVEIHFKDGSVVATEYELQFVT